MATGLHDLLTQIALQDLAWIAFDSMKIQTVTANPGFKFLMRRDFDLMTFGLQTFPRAT